MTSTTTLSLLVSLLVLQALLSVPVVGFGEIPVMKTERCLLKSYPDGPLSPDNFEFDSKELTNEEDLPQDAIVVELKHVSVDPYMRTRFKPGMGYIMPGFELGKPIESACVAQVVASKNDKYKVGSLITGMMPWETTQVVKEPSFQPLPQLDGIPSSYFLGILGLTGLSAYLPFKHYAKDFLKAKEKPVVFVSGSAGAVGSVFAQLCKSIGCTVYGSAGTGDKIALCKSSLGCDDAFNYKDGIAAGLDGVLKDQTIDLYFDNVGGEMLDEVLVRMSMGGKIICCGSISGYETKDEDLYGVQNLFCVTTKRLQMQGFLLGQWGDELPQASQELGEMLAAKDIVAQETVLKGFDKVVEGLIGLFKGSNTGKMIITV
ncbi:alkenal reductase [Seminavis robusta]|uniref:Alkenal reductase n=1 Tax=Seminavis robusta TaxID=568900 RepID=A0A9N8DXC7_9STRA|nr:alkenal reductase [Seminavis robusta]|eukprot:Sro344_g122140.1 alkenal reductase (374) ;mRNA; f:15715-16836